MCQNGDSGSSWPQAAGQGDLATWPPCSGPAQPREDRCAERIPLLPFCQSVVPFCQIGGVIALYTSGLCGLVPIGVTRGNL